MLPHLLAALLIRPPIQTPYAQQETLAIRSVSAPESVARYAVEDIDVDARGAYDNPFDPEEIALDAQVMPPDGSPYEVPGFLYRPFSRHLTGAAESLEPAGDAGWRVRICPEKAGLYRVTLRLKDRSGMVTKDLKFRAVESTDPGFVGVSPVDHHFFAFRNGASYFPIGANVCWAGPAGTYDYDKWVQKFGAEGCNYLRLWLGPWWTTLALEKPGKPSDGAGMGQFDLGDAWRLDHVLDLASKNGMYAMLCIDSYNELRDRDAANEWERTPQNRDNGGPLRIWSEFWTSPEMDRLYRNKLRYLVARYGAYTHVLSWEFWNEVDLVRDYNPDQVRAWHQRMGSSLRTLDPYHHLVTTSFSDSMGERSIDLLPELDYVQTHLYSPNLVGGIAYQQDRKAEWGKPHYVGEVGADSGGPRAKEDTQGLQVHDPLWVSLASGSAGGAMPWWWDNLIEPNDLYHLFGALHRFTNGIDFAREGFRQVDVGLSYADPHIKPLPGDLILDSGPVSWKSDPANQPMSISIRGGKMEGSMPAGLLHGRRNHPTLHNPLTISIHEPKSTELLIGIQEVSTYGGAALHVTLDGSTVVNRVFDTGEENKDPAAGHRFDGAVSIQIPAGAHRLVIDDPGNDWIRIGYRFRGIVARTGPSVSQWTLIGNDVALAWFRNGGRSWRSIVVEKQAPPPAPPTILSIPGLAMGRWKAEIWDTWSGRPTRTTYLTVELNGTARLALPTIASDLAVKLVKTSP